MRSKMIILAVAVALGLLSAFFVARYLDSARADLAAGAEPVVVLVATRDVAAGASAEEIIEKGYAEPQEVPRQFVADGAVSSAASITDRVLATPLTRGEQLTSARFKVASDVGLAYAIPEGYVALSVADAADRGVSGFPSPGDYVMVIASFDSDDLEKATTRILVQKARVLAAGVETSDTVEPVVGEPTERSGMLSASTGRGGDGSPKTITLALTPVDAERVVFAQESGLVWYALLSSDSTNVPQTEGETYPKVLR
jgi:Flp pilus assembly protein CpaB